MTPSGHVDMTIWLIVPNVVTNANPHPTDARTFSSWSFGPPASIIGVGTDTDHASGPNGMSCSKSNGKQAGRRTHHGEAILHR